MGRYLRTPNGGNAVSTREEEQKSEMEREREREVGRCQLDGCCNMSLALICTEEQSRTERAEFTA